MIHSTVCAAVLNKIGRHSSHTLRINSTTYLIINNKKLFPQKKKKYVKFVMCVNVCPYFFSARRFFAKIQRNILFPFFCAQP